MSALAALLRRATFRHGVHPDEMKALTASRPIEQMPFGERYVLPLSQHAGAPSRPLVAPGMHVKRGQMIAAPDGFVSTALHAPVTGTVEVIEPRPHPNGKRIPAIVIRTDPFSSQQLEGVELPQVGTPEDTVRQVQEAGIVGLGGAAFPSHVKLKVPEGKKARFAILNGCECEPYLTCDHRMMVERPQAVIDGLRQIMRHVGAPRGYVGIERNKPDAIEALRSVVSGDPAIEVVGLEVKYPQGAEKMLIDAIFHREVPSGKLPLDLEMLVNNIGTAVAMTDLFEQGKPLIDRVVTVTGPGIRRPANLIVPIGTPLSEIVDYCGGLDDSTRQVILGGPMMGMSQKTLDVPILKGVSGILALTGASPALEEDPCIRCGRCLEACPMFLNPSRLAILAREDRAGELEEHHMLDCFECASCSFVCPSNIPLVQLMRLGKAIVRQKKTS
jgi:electron transport complex protein RnfC